MRTTLRFRTALCAVLAVGLTIAAHAQVLDQVPADALVVIKVNNLQNTSQQFGKWATDVGLAAFRPETADPLGAFQQQLGVNEGMKTDGEMAFAMLDPEKYGGAEQTMVMLLPVTDYKTFLANFGDAKTDGAVSEVTFPNSAEPGYIAQWGNYAALSPVKEIVQNKPEGGIKVQGAVAKQLGQKSISVLANMPVLKEQALAQINRNREHILRDIQDGLEEAQMGKEGSPTSQVLSEQILNAATSFLNDAQGAVFAVDFGNEGITTTTMAEFVPNSYLGNLVNNLKGSNDPLVTGLPTETKYLFLGGMDMSSESLLKVFDDVSKPFLQAATEGGEQDKAAALNKYVAAIRASLASTKRQSFGLVAPDPNAQEQEQVMKIVSVQKGDPQAIKQAQKDIAVTQGEATKALGQQQGMTASFTQNVKTVDGVAFDQITQQFSEEAQQEPGGAQAARMMEIFYGAGGLKMLQGVVGDAVVSVSGLSDEMISQTIKAVKENQNPVTQIPGAQQVTSQLPQQRLAVFYVPVDNIVQAGSAFAGRQGMNFQVNLPPDLPPIGASVATEGTALRIDSYTPTPLVQSLVTAAMQFMMNQGGGRQPGGPGGL